MTVARSWLDLRTVAKTGSYWVVHVTVASLVAYAITGDLWTALTLSLLEPTVQAFAFFAHEKAWETGRPAGTGDAEGRVHLA